MLHPDLRKWLGGNLRWWVALGFLFTVWAMTDQFWIGLIGAVVAWFRLAGPIEQLLGRGVESRESGRYGERRYSFEDAEPVEIEMLPRYSAAREEDLPLEVEIDEEAGPVEVAARPARPMSSVKVPPRKPVDLPRRR